MTVSVNPASALIRLISAAPRGVAAKNRSRTTSDGRCRVIVAMAFSGSASENVRTEPLMPARDSNAETCSNDETRIAARPAIGSSYLGSGRRGNVARGNASRVLSQ